MTLHSRLTPSRMRLAALAPLAAVAALALPVTADAATNTATFTVTVMVPTSCTITASSINFGTYDGANANATNNATATGGVTTICTSGSTPTVGLSAGASATGTQRRLKDGAATPHYINYNLLQPPNNTPGTACNYTTGTAWGDGTAATTGTVLTLTAAPSIAARQYNVCGSIPAGQDVPVNGTGNLTYNDSVVATITF